MRKQPWDFGLVQQLKRMDDSFYMSKTLHVWHIYIGVVSGSMQASIPYMDIHGVFGFVSCVVSFAISVKVSACLHICSNPARSCIRSVRNLSVFRGVLSASLQGAWASSAEC